MSFKETIEEKENELGKPSQVIFKGLDKVGGKVTVIRTASGKEYTLLDEKIIASTPAVLPEVEAQKRNMERATIERNYDLPVENLGAKQTPALSFTLSEFTEVRKAILKINVGATRTKNIFGQEIDFPLTDWKIDSIVINGKNFPANDPLNPVITIHDTDIALATLQTNEPNTLIIRHQAPLGTGVIVPDVPVDIRLWVSGIEASALQKIPRLGTDLSSAVKNMSAEFEKLVKDNTPVAIAILVIIAIIIVALAYILTTPAVTGASKITENVTEQASAVGEMA